MTEQTVNPLQYRLPISLSMIMARDSRNGIGLGDGLPWPKCKEDFAWFKQQTVGKIILMGYKTWETLGKKPLPGRLNCVLTTKQEILEGSDHVIVKVEGGIVFYFSTKEAFMSWLHDSTADGAILKDLGLSVQGEVMIIGGATVYQQFQHEIHRIYLTTFQGIYEADTFLDIDLCSWSVSYRDARSHMLPSFEIYDRQPIMVASHGLVPAPNLRSYRV